jgi:hypothetical protein
MHMRFASVVFRGAAVWGLLVLVPLFFMFDGSGIEARTMGAKPTTITRQGFSGKNCSFTARRLA